MLNTPFGVFNGKTWEHVCQLVFKAKYADDGYQQIAADPGDFGLEGFTIKTGQGFQCYCPEKHYDTKYLYEAQRDKITEDLGKLIKYQKELQQRLGSTKIKDWIFVSPVIDRNALLVHAKHKEIEVQKWKLPFLDGGMTIQLRDADFYAKEIGEARSIDGIAYNFDTDIPKLPKLDGKQEEYEGNLRRKAEKRLEPKLSAANREKLVAALYQSTLSAFVGTDGFLRTIEERAPTVYVRLLRIFNEYEHTAVEKRTTWVGSAEALTESVRTGLVDRILKDLAPKVDSSTAERVARHLVSRWLAVCQLDFDE